MNSEPCAVRKLWDQSNVNDRPNLEAVDDRAETIQDGNNTYTANKTTKLVDMDKAVKMMMESE